MQKDADMGVALTVSSGTVSATYSYVANSPLVGQFQSISPTASLVRVDLEYDSQSRRIQKIVSTNNGSLWIGVSTNRYLYDGWNLVAVVDHLNNLVQSFAWGTDLSGSQRGAGGVGGLLSMTVASGTLAGTYFYAHDGNGNVLAAVNAADGSVSARYDYGPFGEPVRASGSLAQANPFRFSTVYYDDETDLLCYLHRYYNPSTGRFLTRDPLGDVTFMKSYIRGKPQSEVRALTKESLMPQYQFTHNDAADRVDRFGLSSEPDVTWAPPPCPRGQITAFIQVYKGYFWDDGGPHVDNEHRKTGAPRNDKSNTCPLYPLPSSMTGVFQDTPGGLGTGHVQFTVCRVCLETCCSGSSKVWYGRGGTGTINWTSNKIASVGPCVNWKTGGKGDFYGPGFTINDGPSQDWQVGMDSDFPDAAKGGCFKCGQ